MANRKPEKPKALRALSSEELRKIYAALPKKPRPIIKTGEPILLWDMYPLDPDACPPTILEPYQKPNGFYFFNRLRMDGCLTAPLPLGIVYWLMDHGGKRPEDFDCRQAYRPTEEDLVFVERLYGDRNPPWEKIAADLVASGIDPKDVHAMAAPALLATLQRRLREAATPRSERGGKEAKALALLQQHPEWSDAEIAKRVPCNRSSLYRMRRFQAARAWLKEQRNDRPRGYKSDDGMIEAWDDD